MNGRSFILDTKLVYVCKPTDSLKAESEMLMVVVTKQEYVEENISEV